jgi:hypothetical protein
MLARLQLANKSNNIISIIKVTYKVDNKFSTFNIY